MWPPEDKLVIENKYFVKTHIKINLIDLKNDKIVGFLFVFC